MAECGVKWGDRRPGRRRGLGHRDGRPQHACKLPHGHAAENHRCECGAANANPKEAIR